MKAIPILRPLSLMILLVFAGIITFAQSTSFTYQGELSDSSQPANGAYDFEFLLFDAAEGGTQLGSTVLKSGVQVADGKFSVVLDYGAVFNGDDRYLEIRVTQSAQPGQYATLTPRQKVMSVPYAMKSLASDVAAVATDADNLGGVSSGQYVLTTDPRMTDARPPTSGSGDYIQNTTTEQTGSNFNISGTGKANFFDATTQYNIAGDRILSVAGTSNLFGGRNAGAANTGNDNTFVGRSAGKENTTGSYNAFFGANAGLYSMGVSNSFFGSWAGHLNTAGNGNSFFGREAGYNNTDGSRNTFYGRNAGRANTTGTNNTAIGYGANFGQADLIYATAIGADTVVSASNTIQLGRADGSDTVLIPGPLSVSGSWGSVIDVTTQYDIDGSRVLSIAGISNLFIGQNAGIENSTGTDNTFVGRSAGRNNTSASYNTIVGANAGSNNAANNNSIFGAWSGTNTTGGGNSFFGSDSGFNTTTGIRNTFLGRLAGNANTIGSNLTMVGYGANVGSPDLSFATAVGSGAVVSTSNTIQLGRADGSDTVLIPGNLTLTGTMTGNLPAGSGNYIQNGTTTQPTSYFDISNTGTADVFNARSEFRIGGQTLLSAYGISNVFVGRSVGASNTGTSNTFVGYYTGRINTSGSRNSFFGRSAGWSNTSGNDNSFFGYFAGVTADGPRNSLFGSNAGAAVTTGYQNSFFGSAAGSSTITGNSNSFFGRNAGQSNTTGSSNTAIGEGADVASGSLQNATAIGAGAVVTKSNHIQLGGVGTIIRYLGSAPGPNSYHVCHNDDFELRNCNVSFADMMNVESLRSGLELIQKLRPVSFNWRQNGTPDIGLVAEEVGQLEPLLTSRNRDGQVDGIRNESIGVLLVNAVKEQQAQIEGLKEIIERQQAEIDLMKQLVCARNSEAAICQEK